MEQQPPELVEAIEAFLETHEMSPITFGRKALNDPHFVRDLRNGRDVKMSTVGRVHEFMVRFAESPAQADAA